MKNYYNKNNLTKHILITTTSILAMIALITLISGVIKTHHERTEVKKQQELLLKEKQAFEKEKYSIITSKSGKKYMKHQLNIIFKDNIDNNKIKNILDSYNLNIINKVSDLKVYVVDNMKSNEDLIIIISELQKDSNVKYVGVKLTEN